MSYTQQDLRCNKCRRAASGMLSAYCECSGTFELPVCACFVCACFVNPRPQTPNTKPQTTGVKRRRAGKTGGTAGTNSQKCPLQ